MRAFGDGTHWVAERWKVKDIAESLKLQELAFEVTWRPSELELQDALRSLPAAPENELIAYQVDVGYSAMGARPLDGMWIKKGADGIYEARMPVIIFGCIQSREGDPTCPFDDGYCENYCRGRANSREAAVKLALLDAAKNAAGLWE